MDWENLAARLQAELPRVIREYCVGSADLPDDRYVQWAGFPEGLQIEVVSNAFLDEALTFSERRALQLLDWHPPVPPDVPNFFRRFEHPVPVTEAADAILAAARVLAGENVADPIPTAAGESLPVLQPEDDAEDLIAAEHEDRWAGLVDESDLSDDEDEGEEDEELALRSSLGGMSAPEVLDVALGRSWAIPDSEDRMAAIHQLMWQSPERAEQALLALAVDIDLHQSDRRSILEIAVQVGAAVGLAAVWAMEQTIARHLLPEDWLELLELRPDARPHHWPAAYAAVMRNAQLDDELRAEAAAHLWFEARTGAALELILDTMPHSGLAYSLYERDQDQSPCAGALLERLAESESVPWPVRVDAAGWLLDHNESWQTTGEYVLLALLRSDSTPVGVRARALHALRDTGRPQVLAAVIDPSWDEDELQMTTAEEVIARYLTRYEAIILRTIATEAASPDSV